MNKKSSNRTKHCIFFLLSLYLNFPDTIGNEIFKIGTFAEPFFHNLLSPQQVCWIHIVSDKLASENLGTTANLPVTLSSPPINSSLHFWEFNLLENKGWFCELLFFYGKVETIVKGWLGIRFTNYVHFNHLYVPRLRGYLFKVFLTSKNPMKLNNSQNNQVDWYFDGSWKQYGDGFAILYLPNSTEKSPTLCVRQGLWFQPILNVYECNIDFLPIIENTLVLPEPSIWGTEINKKDSGCNRQLFHHIFSIAMNESRPVWNTYKRWDHLRAGKLTQINKTVVVRYPVFHEGIHSWAVPQHKIMTKFEGWNFLTCHRKPAELSFRFYTDPFQLEVWLLVLPTVIVFSILTDAFIVKWLKLGRVCSSLFFFIGAFLEETSSLPSQILSHSVFRVGVGPWILLSSILSNVYVSLIMKGLNVPPEPTRFTIWESLVPWNYSNGGPSENNLIYLTNIFEKSWIGPSPAGLNSSTTLGFSILSAVKLSSCRSCSKFSFAQVFYKFMDESYIYDLSRTGLSGFYGQFCYSFTNTRLRWYPKRWQEVLQDKNGWTAIEEEIVECAESVYVAKETEITQYEEHLRQQYPFKVFYSGKKVILKDLVGWGFDCSKNSKILKYYKSFVESGVYDYYYRNYSINMMSAERVPISRKIKKKLFQASKYYEEQRVRKLDLGASINTLFILLMCLLFLAACGFLMENLSIKYCWKCKSKSKTKNTNTPFPL